jgi:hypothetical protein
MASGRKDEVRTVGGPETEEQQEAREATAVADYQPRGGDDLVPPEEDRPADGELGAGD